MNFTRGVRLIIGMTAFWLLVEVHGVCQPRLKDAEKVKEAYKKLINGGKKENQKCKSFPLGLVFQVGTFAGKSPEDIQKMYANTTGPTPRYELSLEAELLEKYVDKVNEMCSMRKELFCDEKEKKCKVCKNVTDPKCRVLRDIKNPGNGLESSVMWLSVVGLIIIIFKIN